MSYRILKTLLTLVALSFNFANAQFKNQSIQPLKTSYITIEQNSSKILHLKHLPKTMYLSNPKIASYMVKSPGLVYLKATIPGKTNLMLLNDKGEIVKAFYITVTHQISLVKKLLRQTFPIASANLRFKTINNHLIISGIHISQNHQTRINKLIAQIIPKEQVLDMSSISSHTASPQINLHIKVVEMDRRIKRALGLNFGLNFNTASGTAMSFNSPSLTPPQGAIGSFLVGATDATTGNNLAGLFFGNFSLRSLLNIMSDEHLITSLAEPNLILMPNVPGSFLFGGEVPVNNAAGLGGTSNVTYKDYGIKIKATAQILENNIIRLKLNPSVSKLSASNSLTVTDSNNNSTVIQGFLTRDINTTVDLRSGQSLAIAGLIESESTQTEAHIPGLNNIPLLSDLTRQEGIERTEVELVFIVTPYLVHPAGNHQLNSPLNNQGLPKSGAALGRPGFIVG